MVGAAGRDARARHAAAALGRGVVSHGGQEDLGSPLCRAFKNSCKSVQKKHPFSGSRSFRRLKVAKAWVRWLGFEVLGVWGLGFAKSTLSNLNTTSL